MSYKKNRTSHIEFEKNDSVMIQKDMFLKILPDILILYLQVVLRPTLTLLAFK